MKLPSELLHKIIKIVNFDKTGETSEKLERWTEKDASTIIGEEIETRIITASGNVVKPKDITSICSVCNKADSETGRSDISDILLCRVCQRKFKNPSGKTLIVSPSEEQELDRNFNEWEAFDDKRKQPQ